MNSSHILLRFSLLFTILLSVGACGSKSDSKPTPVSPVNTSVETDNGGRLTFSRNGIYNVEVEWSPVLVAGTLNNVARVHFHTANGEHAPAKLKGFHLYHATMGHGSIKENEMIFTEEETGHWVVSNIYFSMPGAASSWVVDIEAELNGVTDTARVVIDAEVL